MHFVSRYSVDWDNNGRRDASARSKKVRWVVHHKRERGDSGRQAGRLFSSPPVHPCRGGVYNENQAGLVCFTMENTECSEAKILGMPAMPISTWRDQPLSAHTQQQRASQAASSGPIPGRLCAAGATYLHTYTHVFPGSASQPGSR